MHDKRYCYSSLAPEYYDESRHPTCANFRYASSIILRRWLPRLLKHVKRACELGAGRSLLAELLEEMDRYDTLRELVITDASTSMLAHSLRWAEYGVVLQCAQASYLPFRDGWFDLVVAASGDPYNEKATWREAARVLREGGYCIFTTPSHQWALNYRNLTKSEIDSAEFELRSGERITVPSFIFPRERQEHEMRKAGLSTIDYQVVTLQDIEDQSVSPKLLLADRSLPVMEGYIARRSGSGGL